MPRRLLPLLAASVAILASAFAMAQRSAAPAASPRAEPSVPEGAAAWRQDHTRRLRDTTGFVRLEQVDLGGGLRADLELAPGEFAAEGLQIVASRFVRAGRGGRIESRTLPRPDLRVHRGVARDAEGRAIGEAWIATGSRILGGFVRLPDGVRFISSGPTASPLPALAFDPASVAPSLLPPGGAFCETIASEAAPTSPAGGVAAAAAQCYELDVAVETDLEFSAQLFGGDLEAASEYALALIAASGEIFDLDLSVRLRTSYLRLWEQEDPWTESGTANQLFQFRDHWQALMSDVPRDLAHFLSGRGLGGGVAWLPGICGSYGYALSANLGGSFPYPLEDHRHENWDLMVVTHEFGHNVGSPHTHSVSPPLDGCGNNDCSQAYGGTIMSYCHICPGGLSNIVLSFHPGSIDSMLATLANVPCDYSGGPEPIAGADAATALAGDTLVLDVLRNDRGGDCSEVELASHDPTTMAGHAVAMTTGEDGRSRLAIASSVGAVGADGFAYSIVDAFGATASAEVSLEWVLPRRATTVVGAAPGLVAKHFAIPESSVLPDFSALEPIASEVVPFVEFPSTGGDFAGSGRADLVASLFTGWIEIPIAGVWTLFTDSDDGSRLWIGDALVVDNDGLHGMVERSGTIALAAGRHPVRVEFFENYGGAGLIVRWAGPQAPKATVPASAWSHGGTAVSPDLDGDGSVGGGDLAVLLASWGGCPGCLADLDGNGEVGGADLAALLAAWGSP